MAKCGSTAKTVDKITGATDGRPFAIGLDREFYGGSARQPAQGEFDALFAPDQGFRAFYDFVDDIENAVPILLPSSSADQVLLQLGNADALGRGLFVHFSRGEVTPVLSLAGATPPLPHDTVFVVDAGWSRDILQLTQWATTTVQRIVNHLPDAEIVVMASSFPDSFGHIVGHGLIDLLEEQFYNTIRSTFNQARLTYGDWATTRPAQSGGGGTIPPRIDIPFQGHCDVFRADEGESYSDVASAAMAHVSFSQLPPCYGRALIESTGDKSGITGTQRATEARLNIHMVRHSSAAPTGAEEAYVD